MATTNPPIQGPDKEKFRRILQTEGLNVALTLLHKEMWDVEFECFEGAQGYRPELFELLKEYREFSLELWDSKLTHSH